MMASNIVFRTRIRLVDFADAVRPHSPMAETEDLKSFQCRFESDWGHHPLIYFLDFLHSILPAKFCS